MRCLPLLVLTAVLMSTATAQPTATAPAFSTAGFHELDPGTRHVDSFNPGWRFLKADAAGAQDPAFDDSAWTVVNLPHGLEVLPLGASGGVNTQGPAWYRKHFDTPGSGDEAADHPSAGRRHFLHLEGVMGKSKVWLNGHALAEHFGGYLPIHLDLTDHLAPAGEPNVLAVRADNRDDGSYPPGKPQAGLDFTYFGGIYRDVWLITTSAVRITHANANAEDEVAGGGVFFWTQSLSDDGRATTHAKVHLRNGSDAEAQLAIETTLVDADGQHVATSTTPLALAAGEAGHAEQVLTADNPALWHPDHPHLHDLQVRVRDAHGAVVDALTLKVGIRTVELRGPDGLFINGQHQDQRLVGGNRHQDFAHLGNALPNATHWRDAKLLRDAGMRIIRVAHYPQDPAFMDACDALGLFVIVATPGWQYFTNEGPFAQRVVSDIRQMVRRDRNHASLFAWEPILNETPYPGDFAANCAKAVNEEYPVPGSYQGSDSYADTAWEFQLMYGHSDTAAHHLTTSRWWDRLEDDASRKPFLDHYKTANFFVREFGDNVNDWNAQDSTSRVDRAWGEALQLVQLLHYDRRLNSIMSHVDPDLGGCLWHPFDHQRGYHPDAFWGGLTDATRRPKYAYHLFAAQRDPDLTIDGVSQGPFVKILHEQTAGSAADVHVVSNCDAVRLTVNGVVVGTQRTRPEGDQRGARRVVTFKNAYDFQANKNLIRDKREAEVLTVAEGLIDGEPVTRTEARNPGRRTKIALHADHRGVPLTADGSDVMAVVARLTDDDGLTKRMGEARVTFTVEGPATLVNDPARPALGINPQITRWGEAVVLLRATTEPGEITVHARVDDGGDYTLQPDTLILRSVASPRALVFKELPARDTVLAATGSDADNDPNTEALRQELETTRRELNELRLREVERTQAERATDR